MAQTFKTSIRLYIFSRLDIITIWCMKSKLTSAVINCTHPNSFNEISVLVSDDAADLTFVAELDYFIAEWCEKKMFLFYFDWIDFYYYSTIMVSRMFTRYWVFNLTFLNSLGSNEWNWSDCLQILLSFYHCIKRYLHYICPGCEIAFPILFKMFFNLKLLWFKRFSIYFYRFPKFRYTLIQRSDVW